MAEAPKLPNDSDSRLKGYFGQVTHPTLPLQRTYCFLCGAPSGFASMETFDLDSPSHIVVTCQKCDEDLIERYGIETFPLRQVPQSILDAFGFVPENK